MQNKKMKNEKKCKMKNHTKLFKLKTRKIAID